MFTINPKLKLLLGSLIVAAVLLLAVVLGLSAGKNLAQAETVAASAQSLAKAFEYFYNDQGRFPTAVEFTNQNVMLNYLSGYNLPSFTSKICSDSLQYKKALNGGYVLDFCLPTAARNYAKGWNKIQSGAQ
ncbi:MAG: hypothetical protein HY918_00015 [Candidatus Doudnabacteria bacterium]|nr:hypothetical protein [Candidatus Doudnabacteria bacterium]